MPLSSVCPTCSTKLNAPDSAAGKRVKCPKCQTILVLAAPEVEDDAGFEVVEPEKPPLRVAKLIDSPKAAPAKPKRIMDAVEEPKPSENYDLDDDEKPRPKSRSSRRDDDEDEDDYKPKPRKKKAKKRSSSSSSGGNSKLAAIGGVLFTILVIVGVCLKVYSAYYNVDKIYNKPTRPDPNQAASGGPGGNAPTGSNWQEFTVPELGLTVSTPVPMMDGRAQAGAAVQNIPSFLIYMGANGDSEYAITSFEVDPAQAPRGNVNGFLDKALTDFGNGAGLGSPVRISDATLAGTKGRQAVFQNGKYGVMRVVFTRGKMLIIGVVSRKSLDENSPDVLKFLNSAKW
ncbi:MAG: hypothetical protein ACRC8S_04960 [Fimbriiglobus sp.]